MTDMAKPVAFEAVDVERPPLRIFRHAAAKIATTPMMLTVIFVFIGGTIWTMVYSLTASRGYTQIGGCNRRVSSTTIRL